MSRLRVSMSLIDEAGMMSSSRSTLSWSKLFVVEWRFDVFTLGFGHFLLELSEVVWLFGRISDCLVCTS